VGGRNGGEMEKSSLEMETREKKTTTVKKPRKNRSEAAGAGGKGKKKAAAKKPGRGKKTATKKIGKKKHKGAGKALRHAVQKEVKEKCGRIAERLVNQTRDGDMRSAAMVMDLMEKKKKGAEGDAEPDGPSLAEQLAGPSWDELQEAKRIVSEKEAKKETA
jgi:hypothetical protein